MNQYMQSMESINQTGYHVRLIICGLHVKQYETKFIGNDPILITCEHSQVNKTLSLWKAQSNALSRVSPSRWGVTKPDVVVLNSEYLLYVYKAVRCSTIELYQTTTISVAGQWPDRAHGRAGGVLGSGGHQWGVELA